MKNSKSNESEDSKKVEANELGKEINENIAPRASQLLSGMQVTIKAPTGSYTLKSDDVWINCANPSDAIIYMPLNPEAGRMVWIKRCDMGKVTINGNGKRFFTNTHLSVFSLENPGFIGLFIFDGGDTWHAKVL